MGSRHMVVVPPLADKLLVAGLALKWVLAVGVHVYLERVLLGVAGRALVASKHGDPEVSRLVYPQRLLGRKL